MPRQGNDRFATDPTGRLAAGAPSGGGGFSGFGGLSVGRVGMPMQDFGRPRGETVGTGYGASFSMPIGKKLLKGRAKGGSIDGEPTGGKKPSKAKKYAKGGSTASKRADGCATKGKTKGRMV